MADYKLTMHSKDTGVDDDKTQAATIVVTFKNPNFKPAHEEDVETPVMQYEESGEIKRDAKGEPVYKDEKQTVQVEAEGEEELSFTQDIFVPVDKTAADKVAKEYAADYEKNYTAATAE